MKIFSKEVEKLLIPPQKNDQYILDKYDIPISKLIKNWKEINYANTALLGIPFDTSCLIRRGSSSGPEGVRNSLIFSNSYEPSFNIDLSTNFNIVDFGNIDVVHTNILETHARIEKVVTAIYRLGIIPIIIGGDHGTAHPVIKSLIKNVEGNIGVINFDAHLDVRKSPNGEITSGTPFRRLMEEAERPLMPTNFVEIGINGWCASKYYRDYCKEQGVTIITAREVHKRGIEDTVSQALEVASKGTKAIFLSFDVDVLDCPFAPGTCALNPGGLTSYQALEAVWQIGQHPSSQGIGIFEIAPLLDIKNLTSHLGAALIMNYIGSIKKRLQRTY